MTEAERQERFPICREQIYFAHAGVTALPRAVADAMSGYIQQSATHPQEFGDVLRDVRRARRLCAEFIGADADEIALLGPTSLGLSLFANGIPWEPGDEVICYAGDYPANVYPWLDLRRRGVIVRLLEPERPGEITPELVARRAHSADAPRRPRDLPFLHRLPHRLRRDRPAAARARRPLFTRRHPDARRLSDERRARRFPQRRRAQMDARPARDRDRLREAAPLRPAAPHAARRLERRLAAFHRAARDRLRPHRATLRAGRPEHRRRLRHDGRDRIAPRRRSRTTSASGCWR